MIQTLNIILFTSIEFSEIRTRLKDLSIEENRELFINLYRSWCHNPISTFSLCLMAYEYQHAYFLVRSFSKLDISVNFLLEIDKLVYLLESPIFTRSLSPPFLIYYFISLFSSFLYIIIIINNYYLIFKYYYLHYCYNYLLLLLFF